MKYILTLMVTITFFSVSEACVTYNPDTGVYTVDSSGYVENPILN